MRATTTTTTKFRGDLEIVVEEEEVVVDGTTSRSCLKEEEEEEEIVVDGTNETATARRPSDAYDIVWSATATTTPFGEGNNNKKKAWVSKRKPMTTRTTTNGGSGGGGRASILLQREKQTIAYPAITTQERQGKQQQHASTLSPGPPSSSSSSSSAAGAIQMNGVNNGRQHPHSSSMFGGGPTFRGIGKNAGSTDGSNNNNNNHTTTNNNNNNRRTSTTTTTFRGLGKNDGPQQQPSSLCDSGGASQTTTQNIAYPKVLTEGNTAKGKHPADQISKKKKTDLASPQAASAAAAASTLLRQEKQNLAYPKVRTKTEQAKMQEEGEAEEEEEKQEEEYLADESMNHDASLKKCGGLGQSKEQKGKDFSKQQTVASSSELLRQEKQNIAYPIVLTQQQQRQEDPSIHKTCSTTKDNPAEKNTPTRDVAAVVVGSHRAITAMFGGGPALRGIGKNAGDGRINTSGGTNTTNNANPQIPTYRGLLKNDGPQQQPSSLCDSGGASQTTTATTTSSLFLPTNVGKSSKFLEEELDNVEGRGHDNHHHHHHHHNTTAEFSTKEFITKELTLADGRVSDRHLVEALPVNDDMMTMMMEAQPVYYHNTQNEGSIIRNKDNNNNNKRGCLVCVASFVGLFLIVSLTVALANQKYNPFEDHHDPANNREGTRLETVAPNSSVPATTRPLPPMENLESLYNNLPETTKESLLYNNNSPQYLAWEWLLNHPYIITYPEWRKQQLFAVATIFYALQGPHWPPDTPGYGRWMDVNTSECEWPFSNKEVEYWATITSDVLGPHAYEYQDFVPCNPQGRIKTIFVNGLHLPPLTAESEEEEGKLFFPPQIGMLTSLKILGIGWSSIDHAKLSDFVIPQVVQQLPQLELLAFQDSGVSGTIPTIVAQLTNLRHLLIGASQLTGTLPQQLFSKMTALEHISLDNMAGIVGTLPSQLGLLTSLTGLEIDRNSFSGPIPSQMGMLQNMTWLALHGNQLTGSLPTQLGLMTNTTRFRIWNNDLTGPIPSELGLMTNLVDLRLGNDDLATPSSSQNNNFTGILPTELWELSNLEELHLANLPNLHGRVPTDILMPNLTMLDLSGSPHVSGAIPDQACIFVEQLYFDCRSDVLCGCDCDCGVVAVSPPPLLPGIAMMVDNQNNETTRASAATATLMESLSSQDQLFPMLEDNDWPGLFPTPINSPNAITINIKTNNRRLEDTKYEWSLQNNMSGQWSILGWEQPQEQEKLHARTKQVQSNRVYRLELFFFFSSSSEGDVTSNNGGFDWFTITDSTPSPDHPEGTVIWEATGSDVIMMTGSYHVYIWVDGEGWAKVLEDITGPGRH